MYIYGGMNHEDQLLGDLCAFKFTGTHHRLLALRRYQSFV